MKPPTFGVGAQSPRSDDVDGAAARLCREQDEVDAVSSRLLDLERGVVQRRTWVGIVGAGALAPKWVSTIAGTTPVPEAIFVSVVFVFCGWLILTLLRISRPERAGLEAELDRLNSDLPK